MTKPAAELTAMSRKSPAWLAASLLAAGLGLSGCATPKASLQPGPQAAPAAQTDVDFVTYGTALVMFDREEGRIATTNAKDPEVRAAAQSMIDAADKFSAETTPAAQEAGISLPTILPFDLRVRLGHMQVQQGVAISRTYVRDQIVSHENALNALEAEAAGGTNPKLKDIAVRALPVVQANLMHLRQLGRRMPEG